VEIQKRDRYAMEIKIQMNELKETMWEFMQVQKSKLLELDLKVDLVVSLVVQFFNVGNRSQVAPSSSCEPKLSTSLDS
jgi:hypothetical protein